MRIVLLDMEMPKMNGEEAFLEMSRKRRDVPILISSGYNDEKLTRALLDQGLAGFIQKPYRLASLEQNLRRALNEE